RVVEVKIVSRPVEVHEQQLDSDQAELLAISLQLHAEKFLGQAIRGIGFFRISIPQVRLPEGNRCKFGIGTDGSDKNRLFNFGLSALFNQVHTHVQVLIEEGARKPQVGADSTAKRS